MRFLLKQRDDMLREGETMRIAAALGCALLISGAGISAQHTPATTPAPDAAHKTYVLTGCLLMTGVAPMNVFELTDATPAGGAAGAPAASKPVGTSGQKLVYRLQPETGVTSSGVREEQLRMHVGERVEVTVRAPAETASTATRSVTQPQGAPPEQPAPVSYPVTTIKQVSNTCL